MGASRHVTATGGQGRLPPPGLFVMGTSVGVLHGRLDLAFRVVHRLRNHFRGLRLMARPLLKNLLPVLLLLGALTGLSASDDAHGQTKKCVLSPRVCDEGEAYAEALAHARKEVDARKPAPYVVCAIKSDPITYAGFAGNGGCTGSRFGTDSFYFGGTCANRSDYTGPGPWSSSGTVRNGSIGCQNGCDGVWFNGSGTGGASTWKPTGGTCPEDEKKNCDGYGDGYYWNALLKVCEPPEGECPGGGKPNSLGQCAPEPCPAGMVQQADGTCKNKNNECPAGQIKSPSGSCLPGDGQCAAGEVRGKDGTCKRDSDGDGEPDPGEEGEGPDGETADAFSGGDDCRTPPSCSGSPIMCGQARIQWRIDCNTRKNRNIAGGTCASMPVCTGEKCDAVEYSSLLMQWRTACALEKMNSGSGTGSNPDLAAIRNALTGTGGTVDPGTGLPGSGAWQGGGDGDPIQPDTSGYGWGGGSCPSIPAIDVMGATIQFDPSPLCNWLSLGSYFVMGLAALASLRIVATKDA